MFQHYNHRFSKRIWHLALISCFTDMASEMLYPVVPFYLKSIGYSVLSIGLLEGMAEAMAGLSKAYFGQLSDKTMHKVGFVRWGYGLSALAKPIMGFVTAPFAVFSTRLADRLGKGIRTGARDALLRYESTPTNKGAVFGFHRTLDTLGAVLGPLIALGVLAYAPQQYTLVFGLAFIPGLLALFLVFKLKNPKVSVQSETKKEHILQFYQASSKKFKHLFWIWMAFSLVNSADVFLLLRAQNLGFSSTATIGLYILYNIVYVSLALPLGSISDTKGRSKVMALGFMLFALVYGGMSLHLSVWAVVLCMGIYGIFTAATDGVVKAWVCDLVPESKTATAIGLISAGQSVALLIASTSTGWIWEQFGPPTALSISAVVTCILSGIMLFLFRK